MPDNPKSPTSFTQQVLRENRRIKNKARLLKRASKFLPQSTRGPFTLTMQLDPPNAGFGKPFTVSGQVTFNGVNAPGIGMSLLIDGEVVARKTSDRDGYEFKHSLHQFGTYDIEVVASVSLIELLSESRTVTITPKIRLDFEPPNPTVGDSVQAKIRITDNDNRPIAHPWEAVITDPDGTKSSRTGVSKESDGSAEFGINAVKVGKWTVQVIVSNFEKTSSFNASAEEQPTPVVNIAFNPSNPQFNDTVTASISANDENGNPINKAYTYEVVRPDGTIQKSGTGQLNNGKSSVIFTASMSGTWVLKISLFDVIITGSVGVSPRSEDDPPPPPPPEDDDPDTATLEIISFGGTPPGGVAPVEIVFDVALSGGVAPFTYAIAYGDGQSDSKTDVSLRETKFTHLYEQQGSYIVNVTVIDASGSARSSEVRIIVDEGDGGGGGPLQDGDVQIFIDSLEGTSTGEIKAQVTYKNTRPDIDVSPSYMSMSTHNPDITDRWATKQGTIPAGGKVSMLWIETKLPPGVYTVAFNQSDQADFKGAQANTVMNQVEVT